MPLEPPSAWQQSLPVCIWSTVASLTVAGRNCYSMGSQEKHVTDPRMGGCDVARFIQGEICPWVSSVPPPPILPWKKSSCVISKAKTKAKVQSFCFMWRLNPCSPRGLLQPRGAVDLHGHVSPSKREHINKWGECGSPNERELLIVFLGLYPLSLWKTRSLFQNN